MGRWNPGAIAALRELSGNGEVVIWTCRIAPFEPGEKIARPAALVETEKQRIRAMLDAEGLNAVVVWDKPYKPPADAYVDNKGVHYNGRAGAWKALVPKLLVMAGITPVFEEVAA